MRWLMALETNNDPITLCRLMNIFRRKGVGVVTLTIASRPEGFSLMAMVETPESEVEHIFNLLRRTEGIHHVTYYRHEPSGDASFVFIDAETDSSSVARFLETVPESKLVFASLGRYLLEVPAHRRPGSATSGFGKSEILPFARVKTSGSQREMVSAQAS